MNERIKELAGYVEKYISTTDFEGMPEDEMTYDEIFQKKFAELIVTNCAVIATRCESNGTKNIGAEILEHFGVK